MQGLSTSTRTDVSLSLLGIFLYKSEIALRKLALLMRFSQAKVWNIGYLYEEFNIFGILY